MKKIRFDEERTFGVEIEVTDSYNYSRESIAAKIREKGIEALSEGWNHQTRLYWKVTTDGSCGLEIVSPILKGQSGLQAINTVCEALNEVGCKVNKKCGLHVHHGVADYTIKNFKNLFKMYTKYEEGLDQVVPESRRADTATYCGTMIINQNVHSTLEKIEACKTVSEIEGLYCSRYKKLNCQSYVKYGTLEFRQHSGTTDAVKIINWVKLTQFMITKATISTTKSNLDGKNDLYWLLSMLGARVSATWTEDTKEIASYYKARAKALAVA